MRPDSRTFMFPSILKVFDPEICPSQDNLEMSCSFSSEKEGELSNKYKREVRNYHFSNTLLILFCEPIPAEMES